MDKSDHPDDKGHLEEAMKIFGMTKEDLESSDQELKFEHESVIRVVSYFLNFEIVDIFID